MSSMRHRFPSIVSSRSRRARVVSITDAFLPGAAPVQSPWSVFRCSGRCFGTTVIDKGDFAARHTDGYVNMGSFHSASVEDLLSLPEAEYRAPAMPFAVDRVVEPSKNPRDDFSLDFGRWIFLNHGAFGAGLRVGTRYASNWRTTLERQPLEYFDRILLPHLAHSVRRMANYVCADASAVTLIPNVTYGFNAVFQNHVRLYGNQSPIVLWDISYGSLKKAARALSDNVVEIPVSALFDRWKRGYPELGSSHDPMDLDEDLFELAFHRAVEASRKKGTCFKNALLVLDHTTSNTALNMPILRLSRLAKRDHGMNVMVDGAHGLVAQTLDFSHVSTWDSVDVYLSNGHKWMSCPRGVGMMWGRTAEVREATLLRYPAVISHGVDDGFHSRFLWDGCRDYAAALSIPAVLDFWEKYETRNSSTLSTILQSIRDEAVSVLCDLWWPGYPPATRTLAPLEKHAPMMALVLLPSGLQVPDLGATSRDAKRIQDMLYDAGIEVPIKCVLGELYVRISCHVYNRRKDYETLGIELARHA